MRAVFREAVVKDDFGLLERQALRRYKIEQKLQEQKRFFERDMRKGVDCRADLEKIFATWREYE